MFYRQMMRELRTYVADYDQRSSTWFHRECGRSLNNCNCNDTVDWSNITAMLGWILFFAMLLWFGWRW